MRNILSDIRPDLKDHFIIGTLICFILNKLGLSLIPGYDEIIGLAVTFGMAVLKEIFDKLSGIGNPDYKDILATTLGGFIIYI